MDNKQFERLCKNTVYAYVREHMDKTYGVNCNVWSFFTQDDIYVVWMCKTLQNNKALLSTTIHDGMYYECTYNGDKQELYLDAYKKFENKKFDVVKMEEK